MGILSKEQIKEMGFARVGDNVALSDKASYYNCGKITIGNNVRIDDFCVLSAGEGGIMIGNYCHFAVFTSMIGAGKISFGDFGGTSSRVSIYSSSDDYSGEYLVGPQVPSEFSNVHHADVCIGRHVIFGAGSVVLPGVVVEDGASVGALSLVTKSLSSFGSYFGVPARKIGARSRQCLEKEQALMASLQI
ncbi:acyltransferase [Zhongshania aliphaticivorans]|uniref:Galactoside O-acetyltransferase n=2 Tax=Zhongshania aliphaticivorans TaxID=1470434 RepID=A0A127M1Y2_9GAMM|nr:acyltransferase [Zhongshania aliphaticivorans]AMO67227.1 galactoside O-acetyltransferase [Zhongshania aliphaticivorans]